MCPDSAFLQFLQNRPGYFPRFVNIFLCYLFQKQASNQRNLLKTLLYEIQSNLEKVMYGNSSLYSQYF